MLYVDDTHFERAYFEQCFELFERHPLLGDCKNKRIAVCLSDSAFWIALCLYAKARGGSLFPLAVDTPHDAARRRAERSGCSHLIFGADASALDRIETLPEAAHSGSETREPALIQTSSGTTGEPKYIERSWSSIDVEIESYVRHFAAADRMTPIVACPVNHSYGLISGVLVALARGLEPVIVRNLNPKYILRRLSEAESSLLYSSPTLIATLTLLATEENPLFAVMTSGTLMQKSWFEGVRKKVRHLHQQYGCSEAGCVTLGQDITAANDLGTPLPHVELVTGASAASPQEILVKLLGGKTIEPRDLGYLDGGRLHFVSRLDDMINVSGLNVYPSEVEEVVLELPGITDAVVYKRNHGFGSDQVCLHFVSEATVPHRQIREWCAARLASHQVPLSITQVDSIPKLPNGKVSRKALSDASARPEAS